MAHSHWQCCILWAHVRGCSQHLYEAAADYLTRPQPAPDQLPVKNVPSSFLRLRTIATSSVASRRSSLRYDGSHCLVTLLTCFDSLVASVVTTCRDMSTGVAAAASRLAAMPVTWRGRSEERRGHDTQWRRSDAQRARVLPERCAHRLGTG
jgi:hypothetical protein